MPSRLLSKALAHAGPILGLGGMVLARAVSSLAGLITVWLTTRLLGPAEVGRMQGVLTLVTLAALLLVSPLGVHAQAHVVEWARGGVMMQRLRRIIGGLLIMAIVSGLVCVVAARVLMPGLSVDPWVIGGLVAFSLAASSMQNTLIPLLNLLGRRRDYYLLTVAMAYGAAGAGWLFVSAEQATAERWMTVTLIAQAVLLVPVWWCLHQAQRAQVERIQDGQSMDPGGLLRFLRFAGPISIATGLWWIQNQVYRIPLVAAWGEERFGIIITALGVGITLMTAGQTLVGEMLRPRLMQAGAFKSIPEQWSLWRDYLASTVVLIIAGTAVCVGIPGILLRICVDPRFRAPVELVSCGAIFFALIAIVATYHHGLFLIKKTGPMLPASGAGAAVAIAVAWTTRGWQPEHAAAASLIAGAVANLVVLETIVACLYGRAFPYRQAGVTVLICTPLVLLMRWVLAGDGSGSSWVSIGVGLVAMAGIAACGIWQSPWKIWGDRTLPS